MENKLKKIIKDVARNLKSTKEGGQLDAMKNYATVIGRKISNNPANSNSLEGKLMKKYVSKLRGVGTAQRGRDTEEIHGYIKEGNFKKARERAKDLRN